MPKTPLVREPAASSSTTRYPRAHFVSAEDGKYKHTHNGFSRVVEAWPFNAGGDFVPIMNNFMTLARD